VAHPFIKQVLKRQKRTVVALPGLKKKATSNN
jgi:hypothetical protein